MVEECDGHRMYPSDRELVLRSKINLGWSVHTQNVFRRRLRTLSDSEIDLILHVIYRAENSETLEQQRIGCLIQRLENVKNNTFGNGPQSCSMCGVAFGRKKSSVFKCFDCSNSVCNKCCVDTCSVAHEPCMLCKICAEDRELWKKSGGWFYGSLPIYTKTTQKLATFPCSSKATWQTKTPEIVRLESFEPPENEINTDSIRKVSSWLNLAIPAENNLTSPDEPDSSEIVKITTDDLGHTKCAYLKPVNDNMRREASCQYLAAPETNLNLLSMTSLSTSCPSLVPPPATTNANSHQSNLGVVEFYVTYDTKDHVLRCTIYCVKGMDVTQSDKMIYIQMNAIPFLKKVNPLRTKSAKKGNTVAFNETLEFLKFRQEKLKKRMLRLQVLEEGLFDDDLIGDVSVDLTDFKAVRSKFFTLPVKENDAVTSCYGWILLSLRFSPEDHSLVLVVNCCSDLVSSNKTELPNSFVRINLIPDFGDEKCDTTVKNKTTNPTFNEEFTFHLSPLEMKRKSLMITVLEKTGKNHKQIGHVILGIQAKGEMLQHWLEALRKPKINVEKWHALLKERKYGV